MCLAFCRSSGLWAGPVPDEPLNDPPTKSEIHSLPAASGKCQKYVDLPAWTRRRAERAVVAIDALARGPSAPQRRY